MADEQNHSVIWLQPWCDGCQKYQYRDEGRTWCESDIYEPCEECGRQAVKYVLAPDQPSAVHSSQVAPSERDQ